MMPAHVIAAHALRGGTVRPVSTTTRVSSAAVQRLPGMQVVRVFPKRGAA